MHKSYLETFEVKVLQSIAYAMHDSPAEVLKLLLNNDYNGKGVTKN